MEKIYLDVSTNTFSRDLLQSFMGITSEYETVKEEDEEIELNLGLSLGGRFGVDKSCRKLVRSSSIASCLPVVRDDNDAVAPAVAYTGLVRTSSLPVETEDEWRKRKELQTLRRMEAKRRRSEKLRNLKGDKEGVGNGSLSFEERKEIEVNLRGRLERGKCAEAMKRSNSLVGTRFEPSTWATQAILGRGFDAAMTKGKGNGAGDSGGLQGFGPLVSQGSRELKGESSSSISNLESKTLQERSNQDVGSSKTKARENQSKTTGSEIQNPAKISGTSRTQVREIRTNAIEDMPCVFTKGDGPNGRRVNGILYTYGKGEEVRIMCVCHGSFHSPAEFIMHAGGTDVNNPLKHIVINTNSSSLL